MTEAPFPAIGGIFGTRDRRAVTPSAQEQLRKASQDTTATLRRIHILQGKDRSLIDFDLAPATPGIDQEMSDYILDRPSRREWKVVLDRLEGVAERVNAIPPTENGRRGQQREFLAAKLDAYVSFHKTNTGIEVPTMDLIEQTQGKKPELLSEEKLLAQADNIIQRYQSLGVVYTKEGIQAFQAEHQVPVDQVRQRMLGLSENYVNQVSRFLHKKVDPKLDLVEVHENDYWINWSSGTRDKFTLAINLHRRHAHRWTDGKIEAMVQHEIAGHMAQMESWRREIDGGKLIPALGITSVYDPEQITNEGAAMALHYLVPGIAANLSELGELENEVEGLRQMVYNNVHIMANEGVSEDNLVTYVQSFCPAESEEEIKRQIKDRRDHPIKRSYLYAYGIGFALHQWYGMNLNTDGKRKLVEYIYSQPTTPKQEYDFFTALMNEPVGRYGVQKIPFDGTEKPYPDFSEASLNNQASSL